MMLRYFGDIIGY